jgi:uncharacterized membrane protein YccC
LLNPHPSARPVPGSADAANAQPVTLTFAGIPFGSWTFAFRTWIAVVVALYTGFWLQLDEASSSAITVAILAVPTRGQALEKAAFRLIGTIIGVAASIVIVAMLSQTRDLLLVAFAGWVGVCIYAAGLGDGNRAYAAVLSGYTVALVAITQIDAPHQVFDTGVQRGAAIAVGIGALAFVNDLLVAPVRHPGLVAQLTHLHRRMHDYAKAIIQHSISDATTAVQLMREITALRSEITSLATESSSGAARSAAARSTVVALIAELHAMRLLTALPATSEAAIQYGLISALEHNEREHSVIAQPCSLATSIDWAFAKLLRYDREVRDSLSALKAGVPPQRVRRTPLYRSHRIAAEAGVRAAIWLVLPSIFLVVAGWPSTELSLALVPVVIGLGATSPNPRGFTTLALIAMPLAVVFAGILEFVILDGVTQFPLLALALAPVAIAASLIMTLPNQMLASLGRMNLIFILAIFAPSNPQTYNPQSYLFTSLFVCLAVLLLLASQLLVPPLSDQRRRQELIGSARREFGGLGKLGHYSPEEAMFRDAVRIGQIAATGITDSQLKPVLDESLTLFDQAGIVRLCDTSLTELAAGPAASLTSQAREALASRNVQSMRDTAVALREMARQDACAAEASAAFDAATFVLGKKHP